MRDYLVKLVVMVLLSVVPVLAFAGEKEVPFTIGKPTVEGNGCPNGSYEVVLSPDGNELSVLFSNFTATTSESENSKFSSCNIAVPIEVPGGITVGLLGVDYRGLAYIPNKGTGMITREYFIAGRKGPQITSEIPVHDEFYEFFYPDEVKSPAWTDCGDDITARSNTTIYVSKPADSPVDAIMSLLSEDWDLSIMFHLMWDHCK